MQEMRNASPRCGYISLTRIFLVWLALGVGCSSESKVTPLGEGYGLQNHGGELPHSARIVSLVRTNREGKWVTVWHAISFRCEGPVVWNRSILFGAVTDEDQAEKGRVRLLFFSERTGVVDVTESLAHRTEVKDRVSATFIKLKRNGPTLDVKVEGAVAFETQVTLAEIEAIALSVAERKKKRTFDGVNFSE
jgi:hypothetical protein